MEDDPETRINEAGMWWMTNVPAGTYIVAEVLQEGWEQTYPLFNDELECFGFDDLPIESAYEVNDTFVITGDQGTINPFFARPGTGTSVRRALIAR